MVAISVLLPVYNAGQYLPAALRSLEPDLDADTEIIAVDDGSTDGSGAVLDAWGHPQVTVIHQDNQGLVGALSVAASHARGELLARMDGDDLNHRGRLAACRAALDSDKRTALVSPWARQIDADGHVVGGHRYPWRPGDVDRALYIGNPIIHGAVVMRRSVFERAGGYQPSPCEDLHLWDRMSEHGTLRLLPAVLYDYRVSVASYTSRNATAQAEASAQVRRERWERHRPTPAPPRLLSGYTDLDVLRLLGYQRRDLARTARAHGDRARAVAFTITSAT